VPVPHLLELLSLLSQSEVVYLRSSHSLSCLKLRVLCLKLLRSLLQCLHLPLGIYQLAATRLLLSLLLEVPLLLVMLCLELLQTCLLLLRVSRTPTPAACCWMAGYAVLLLPAGTAVLITSCWRPGGSCFQLAAGTACNHGAAAVLLVPVAAIAEPVGGVSKR
jgi:hypothetical protein